MFLALIGHPKSLNAGSAVDGRLLPLRASLRLLVSTPRLIGSAKGIAPFPLGMPEQLKKHVKVLPNELS